MSDLFGNHIVGFPTRRLIYCAAKAMIRHAVTASSLPYNLIGHLASTRPIFKASGCPVLLYERESRFNLYRNVLETQMKREQNVFLECVN